MLKLEFVNARVTDSGYGLEVNGKPLDEIISTALGTRVDNTYGYGANLPVFKSDCCNVVVIINPQPVTTFIEDDENVYNSVEEMEEEKREQFKKKDEKTDPEE